MTTATAQYGIDQIGEAAGQVWRCLDEHGPMSISKLTQAVPHSRDMVLQGIGWLAREDKIVIEANGRGRLISLR